jgi:hypothetical protein
MQDQRKSCKNCGYPSLLMCPDCGMHVYCAKGCQTSDVTMHQSICEELELERAIVRTADTIQKAYFAFREPLFEKLIVKVEEGDHKLVLHQDNAEVSRKNGWFVDLPSHLIWNKSIAETIVCFHMSREPLAYLLNLIRYLTDGKVSVVLCNHHTDTK